MTIDTRPTPVAEAGLSLTGVHLIRGGYLSAAPVSPAPQAGSLLQRMLISPDGVLGPGAGDPAGHQ